MSFKALISSLILTTFSWLKRPATTTAAPSSPLTVDDEGDNTVSRMCAVCLSGLQGLGTTTGTRTLPCLHEFHAACVDRWLHAKNTCPVCRFSMGGDCSEDGKGVKRQECFTEEMVIWFSSFHVAGF